MRPNYDQLEFCQVEQSSTRKTPKKIHIIHCPEQKAFKVIVSSRDITKCLSELQKGNPSTLTVYISFGGTNDTKTSVLSDCKEYSLHGDWIEDNEAVREYLNSQLNILVN
jgi:hypothetical protein